MLKARYLKRVLAAPPGEPPKVDAVILYHDFTCGLRLKHAFDELFNEVFSHAGWAAHYRLSLWSFQMLRARTVHAMAARESAAASLFAVTADGAELCAPEVTSLVHEWLARQRGHTSALVIAGYGNDSVPLRSSPAGVVLRMAAKRTGTLCLVQPLGPAPFRSLQALEGAPQRHTPERGTDKWSLDAGAKPFA